MSDVWAELISEMRPGPLRAACEARRRVGIERYGRPVGRDLALDWHREALEEILDAAVYLQAAGDRYLARAALDFAEFLCR